MRKQMNILLSLVLVLGLSLSLCLPALGAEAGEEEPVQAVRKLHIRSEKSFLAFAENCRLDSYSQDLVVYLDRDLDLTDTDFEPIPIFCGTFQGNGHTISGLNLITDGSNQGLFRYLTDTALVKDLNVKGRISPGGSQTVIGGIVGRNSGTLENCQFEGSISAKDSVGGIAGINTVTGKIDRCKMQGSISAEHLIGGIAGENMGVMVDCENHAQVNISSQDNTVQVTSITIDTLSGTEDPHTVTDVGGIAGTSSGVIRQCVNRGDVGYKHMGYNIGGIAGSHSGYIADCSNYGTIFARKEAGGIVGQFLPAAQIEYSEDTLQILDKQISSASNMLNRVGYNAQSNMGTIGEGINALREEASIAQDAIYEMIHLPGEEFDPDAFLAAQNTLSESLYSMNDTMGYLNQAAQGTATQLARDVKSVAGQLNAMGQTIREAQDNLGATLTDVSDRDTPDNLTGKVERCRNLGPVSADINAGGIAGAIAFESEADPEDELEIVGAQSLNAEGKLRAVILDCENRGRISGTKVYTGGIAGRATLGLIKGCVNTGAVDGTKGQYAGGIAGSSEGYIRDCHVKCRLDSTGYTGGIAGSGTVVTDCQSMVLLERVTELQGAILGYQLDPRDPEITDPVLSNHYMNVSRDPGAIDGISYAGLAEPMTPTAFLGQENLPETFRNNKLVFRFEDGKSREISTPVGAVLRQGQIPPLPQKEGFTASWEGLEDYLEVPVYFDAEFRVEYTPNRVTIQSPQTRTDGRPIFLAEGLFPDTPEIETQALDLPAFRGGTALEAWSLPRFSETGDTVLHYYLPKDTDPDHLELWLKAGEQSWRKVPYEMNASYAILAAGPEDTALCAVALPDYTLWLYAAGAAGVIALIAALMAVRKKKKAIG